MVYSSLTTLTVTSRGHVTEVLSPAFDAGTLFCEVNITSLTYTVEASASSDELQAWKCKGKRHPPLTLCTRQLPRARKLRCLSRPAMRPQQPMSCTPSFSQFRVIVTLVPVILSSAPVCVTRIVRSSCNAHCPGNVPCHDGEDVQHGIRLGLKYNETFGGPGYNVQSCPYCPLHSLFLEKTQTSSLSGRVSVRALDGSQM